MRCGGRGGEKLEKIQGRALAGEQGAGGAAQFEQGLILGDGVALRGQPFNLNGGVQLLEGGVDIRHAAKNRGFPGDDRSVAPATRWDEGRGDIATPDILRQGPLDLFGKVARDRYRRLHSVFP
jgi:hypothetical protein